MKKKYSHNLSLFLDLSTEAKTPIVTKEPDIESMKESPVQQSRKRTLLSLFNHHHQLPKSSKTGAHNQTNPPMTTPTDIFSSV